MLHMHEVLGSRPSPSEALNQIQYFKMSLKGEINTQNLKPFTKWYNKAVKWML